MMLVQKKGSLAMVAGLCAFMCLAVGIAFGCGQPLKRAFYHLIKVYGARPEIETTIYIDTATPAGVEERP